MKVREFKELAKNIPDDMDDEEIVGFVSDGCCGDILELGPMEANYYPPHKDGAKGSLSVRFEDQLPGFRSCIQSGQTMRLDKEWLEKHGNKKKDH